MSHCQCLDGGYHGSSDTLPLALRNDCNRANYPVAVHREIKTGGTNELIVISKNQRNMLRLSVVRMVIIIPRQSAQIEQNMPSNLMIRFPFRLARYPYQLQISSLSR